MSRERDKLIRILNELEKDYHAGNISQEKYISLRERYLHKINTIDASNRVRSMQSKGPRPNNFDSRRGKPNGPDRGRNNRGPNNYNPNDRFDSYKSRSQSVNHRNLKRPYDAKKLHDNLNRSPYNSKSNEKSKSKLSATLVVLFTVILLCAFGTGIVMGVFNDFGGVGELMRTGASINDTAFPIAEKNVTTVNYNYTSDYSDSDYDYNSSYTDYNSSSDDSGDYSKYDSENYTSKYDYGSSKYDYESSKYDYKSSNY